MQFFRGKRLEKVLFSSLGTRDKLLARLVFEIGCTVSELVSLKVRDIDFRTDALLLGPTRRPLRISEHLSYDLKQLCRGKQPADHLFSTRQSARLTPRRVQQVFKEVSRILEVETTPQAVRAAWIRERLEAGDRQEAVLADAGISHYRRTRPLLTDETIEKAIAAAPERTSLIIMITRETGFRLSRLLSLETKDIDTARKTLSGVRISDGLCRRLAGFAQGKAPSDHLFSTRQSAVLSKQRVQQLLKPYGLRTEEIRKLAPDRGPGGDAGSG